MYRNVFSVKKAEKDQEAMLGQSTFQRKERTTADKVKIKSLR